MGCDNLPREPPDPTDAVMPLHSRLLRMKAPHGEPEDGETDPFLREIIGKIVGKSIGKPWENGGLPSGKR